MSSFLHKSVSGNALSSPVGQLIGLYVSAVREILCL
jgi:hypothetical protein